MCTFKDSSAFYGGHDAETWRRITRVRDKLETLRPTKNAGWEYAFDLTPPTMSRIIRKTTPETRAQEIFDAAELSPDLQETLMSDIRNMSAGI